MEDYKRELLGEWAHDPIAVSFASLVTEYQERTEAYDRTVCSREHNGVAIPMTAQESALINKHARKLRGELLTRACERYQLSASEAESHWREAKRAIRG